MIYVNGIYVNGDGLWLKCRCLGAPKLLSGVPASMSMEALVKLVDIHKDH